MGYIIGVSSGMFGAAGREEQISYTDISQKAFYGALKGVNFTQIDIETATELDSPYIEERTKKIRELGLSYGFHGETPAMRGASIALTSAVRDHYISSHNRLITNLENAGKLKGKYYLIHSCEATETPYVRLGMDLQPTTIVDFYGRDFYIFLEENKYLLDWAANNNEILTVTKAIRITENYVSNYYRELISKELEKIPKNERTPEKIKEIIRKIAFKLRKNEILEFSKVSELTYGSEKVAYKIIAKWMAEKKDPLWMGIVGNKSFEEIEKDYIMWVPAVAAKYIWGHFNPINKFKDPKQILEKYKIYFVIETPMVSAGMEKDFRLTHPKHFVILAKNSNTSYFKIVFDFEHMLGAGINPDKEIEDMIPNGGKYVKVLHVGWPTALQPAHYPIFLGSEQQEWLYKWMFKLRKKGFDESEDRFIIFERSSPIGQRDPVMESTLALKKIIEFLRKDIPPDKLPLEFYGIDKKDFKMQEVQIREHALDPIRGLLTIPEERHSFLSRAAIEKGKGNEWETEKYR